MLLLGKNPNPGKPPPTVPDLPLHSLTQNMYKETRVRTRHLSQSPAWNLRTALDRHRVLTASDAMMSIK